MYTPSCAIDFAAGCLSSPSNSVRSVSGRQVFQGLFAQHEFLAGFPDGLLRLHKVMLEREKKLSSRCHRHNIELSTSRHMRGGVRGGSEQTCVLNRTSYEEELDR